VQTGTFSQCHFTNVNFSECPFSDSTGSQSQFHEVNLSGTSFNSTKLKFTRNLQHVKVRASSGSSQGARTFYLEGLTLPESDLRNSDWAVDARDCDFSGADV
jgi:uncharacterized protein YjbI with pentapeptide repeats